jgi:hypothetical protein
MHYGKPYAIVLCVFLKKDTVYFNKQCQPTGLSGGHVFRRVRKIARSDSVSFAMSVRPSLHPSACSTSTLTGKIFSKLDNGNIFRKSVQKIQGSLTCDKNNGHFT